jgi:hypothetical protein
MVADGGLRLKAGKFFACLAMVGVGAVAGTLSGGYTNAARSPDTGPAEMAGDRSSAVARVASVLPIQADTTELQSSEPRFNTTTVSKTANVRGAPALDAAAPSVASNDPAPAAIIAMRFPGQWQQAARATTGDNDPPAQVLAYAVEPQRSEPVEPAPPATASSSGYQLASVDHAAEPAPMPKRMAKPTAPKSAVLFNDAQLASIKTRLRLTRDQESLWPKVEEALRAISWKLATQQRGIVRGNQASMIDPNSPEVAQLKSAAFPLIMSMREDQKQEVRQLAHTMGLRQVASMF